MGQRLQGMQRGTVGRRRWRGTPVVPFCLQTVFASRSLPSRFFFISAHITSVMGPLKQHGPHELPESEMLPALLGPRTVLSKFQERDIG